jgi:hypothetical protein
LFELDGKAREALPDVVVPLARDPAPLVFVCGDQPSGDRARSRGRRLRLSARVDHRSAGCVRRRDQHPRLRSRAAARNRSCAARVAVRPAHFYALSEY